MPQPRISAGSKRDKLLQAAERLMLQRGYWGTSVDDVCRTAAVTKGSFFYYFTDKEQLALAALDQFVARMVARIQQAVSGAQPHDAYAAICAYCDLIAHVSQVQNAQEGCLIATFVMETRAQDSAFAQRCSEYLGKWIELLRQQFVAALSAQRWPGTTMPAELAQLCICVIEGALIVARGTHDARVVRTALEHFKRYVSLLVHGALPQRLSAVHAAGLLRPEQAGDGSGTCSAGSPSDSGLRRDAARTRLAPRGGRRGVRQQRKGGARNH